MNFTYGKSNSLNDTVLVENKTSSVSFTANPGLTYDISKRFQLELLFFNNLLSAAYSHHILSGTSLSTIKSDDFNIGANLDGSQFSTLNLGAKIFFGR